MPANAIYRALGLRVAEFFRYHTKRPIMLTLAMACAVLITSDGHAAGILLGPFCVENVGSTVMPDSDVNGDGVMWKAKQYSFDAKTTPGKATIVLFKHSVPIDPDASPTCANMKKAAAAAGIPIMLEGRLGSFAMKVTERTTANSTSYIVEPAAFSAWILRVTSGFSTVAGGKFDLAGSQAWIRSPSRINIKGSSVSGTLQIESWNRRIVGAVMLGEDSTKTTLDFKAVGESNITVNLDVGTGVVALREANLVAPDVALGLQLKGEIGQFAGRQWKAKSVGIAVTGGKSRVTIVDGAGHADSSVIGTDPLQLTTGPVEIGWKAATTVGTIDQNGITLDAFAFQGLSLAAAPTSIKLKAAELASGQTTASFDSLSSAAVRGQVGITKPALPALGFAFSPGAVDKVGFTMEGPAAAVKVKSTLDATRLALAGMDFSAPLHLTLARNPGDSLVRIPIELHLKGISGNFTFKDANQVASVIATFKNLDLSATLSLNFPDVANSKIEVPTDGFNVGLLATAAAQPILAGTKPTLASVGVVARNATALTISPAGSQGTVEVTSPLLILGQPIFMVGEKGKKSRIAVDLKANGAATLGYDLKTAAFGLVEGNFQMANVQLKSLDPGFRADLSDTYVDDPVFTLGSLSLELKRGNPTGTAQVSAIQLAASHISRDKDAIRFDGTPNGSFQIQSLHGVFGVDGVQVSLTELTAEKMSFGITNANFDFGDSASLLGASLSLSADRVQTLSKQPVGAATPDGTYFTKLTLQADGNLRLTGDFSLVNQPHIGGFNITLDGRSDQLTGHGSANLGGFFGTFRSSIDTGFECDNGSKLAIPMAGTIASGPSTLDLHADQGDFYAVGSFAGTNVNMVSTAIKTCNGPSHDHVVQEEKWGSMTGWCPTWSDPGRTCEWKTIILPRISYRYHMQVKVIALTAVAFMASPRIKLAKNSGLLCNAGPATIASPAIIAGYYPQFDDNGVLVQIANTVIEAVAIPLESAVATGLVNMGGSLINDPLISTAGTAVCVIRGNW